MITVFISISAPSDRVHPPLLPGSLACRAPSYIHLLCSGLPAFNQL